MPLRPLSQQSWPGTPHTASREHTSAYVSIGQHMPHTASPESPYISLGLVRCYDMLSVLIYIVQSLYTYLRLRVAVCVLVAARLARLASCVAVVCVCECVCVNERE